MATTSIPPQLLPVNMVQPMLCLAPIHTSVVQRSAASLLSEVDFQSMLNTFKLIVDTGWKRGRFYLRFWRILRLVPAL